MQTNHLAHFLLSHELRERAARRPDHQHRLGRAHAAAASTRPTRGEQGSPVPAARLRRRQAGQHPVHRRGGAALAGDRLDRVPPGRGADPLRQQYGGDRHVLQALRRSCVRRTRAPRPWSGWPPPTRRTSGRAATTRTCGRSGRARGRPTRPRPRMLWEASLAAVGLARRGLTTAAVFGKLVRPSASGDLAARAVGHDDQHHARPAAGPAPASAAGRGVWPSQTQPISAAPGTSSRTTTETVVAATRRSAKLNSEWPEQLRTDRQRRPGRATPWPGSRSAAAGRPGRRPAARPHRPSSRPPCTRWCWCVTRARSPSAV